MGTQLLNTTVFGSAIISTDIIGADNIGSIRPSAPQQVGWLHSNKLNYKRLRNHFLSVLEL